MFGVERGGPFLPPLPKSQWYHLFMSSTSTFMIIGHFLESRRPSCFLARDSHILACFKFMKFGKPSPSFWWRTVRFTSLSTTPFLSWLAKQCVPRFFRFLGVLPPATFVLVRWWTNIPCHWPFDTNPTIKMPQWTHAQFSNRRIFSRVTSS